MAIPTNQVKNDTTTHPHTRLAGPEYKRLEPYRGVIPVKSVIVENDIARVLNRFLNQEKNIGTINRHDFVNKSHHGKLLIIKRKKKKKKRIWC